MSAVGEASSRKTPHRRTRIVSLQSPPRRFSVYARVTAHEALALTNFTMAEPSVGGAPAASRQSSRSRGGNPGESGNRNNPIATARRATQYGLAGDSWVGRQLRQLAIGSYISEIDVERFLAGTLTRGDFEARIRWVAAKL